MREGLADSRGSDRGKRTLSQLNQNNEPVYESEFDDMLSLELHELVEAYGVDSVDDDNECHGSSSPSIEEGVKSRFLLDVEPNDELDLVAFRAASRSL